MSQIDPFEYSERPPDDLKPHPKQAEMFRDLSDGELESLADDLDRNGQNFAVEILPDGTIIAGHQRVRAARLLGWTKIDVLIRHDLAQQSADAVEERLIEDNVHRRHLHPLEIARLVGRLKELARRRPRSDKERGDLRDQLAERFNVSGRTLDRYLRVLETPKAVQGLVISGQLSMETAGKIAALSPAARQELDTQLESSEDPLATVRNALRSKQSSSQAKQQVLQAIKQARRAIRAILDETGRMNVAGVQRERQALERAFEAIGRLRGKLR